MTHTPPQSKRGALGGGGGCQWSGCNVRVGLRTTFIAHCPRWPHPVPSGPPMWSGLQPSLRGRGCDCWDSMGSGSHSGQGSLLTWGQGGGVDPGRGPGGGGGVSAPISRGYSAPAALRSPKRRALMRLQGGGGGVQMNYPKNAVQKNAKKCKYVQKSAKKCNHKNAMTRQHNTQQCTRQCAPNVTLKLVMWF